MGILSRNSRNHIIELDPFEKEEMRIFMCLVLLCFIASVVIAAPMGEATNPDENGGELDISPDERNLIGSVEVNKRRRYPPGWKPWEERRDGCSRGCGICIRGQCFSGPGR